MKVVALVSGGKDSCYNMVQCIQHGHSVVALANLRPKDKDEIDSYMYQTVGHHAIHLYAEAMDVPLYRRTIQGSSVERDKTYESNAQDEVEDLFELLRSIQEELSFDAVSVGAILSDYQRIRVEHVCGRLGLTCLSYLWRRNQKELLEEMIEANIQAIVIKVAALGLNPAKHLGLSISEIFPEMCKLHTKYGLNICGEGGEYETFTLDCPLFTKRIVIDEFEVVTHSDDAFAPVGFLHFKNMHLEDKEETNGVSIEERVRSLPVCYEGEAVVPFTMGDPPDIESKEQQVSGDVLQLHESKNENRDMVGVRRCGNYLIVGDILGWSTEGKHIEEVTENVMKKLSEILRKCGSCLSEALLVHLAVKNMFDFTTVNYVYKKYFQVNPPARVCVELDLPEGVLLQLDCLAYTPGSDGVACEHHRETMHVQSVSHWAPANIGPYSQAVKLGHVTYVSGCIALHPATMLIIEDGLGVQSALSLRHVDRIISAFTPGSSLVNVLQGICYVTSVSSVSVARASWRAAWNDKAEDSVPCRGLMSYVVVPALPREALIEWHVVTHDCPSSWQYVQEVTKQAEFKLHYERIWIPADNYCAMNCSVEHETRKNHSVIQLQDVVKTFVQELKNLLENCKLQLKDIITAKIFYSKSVTLASSLAIRNVVRRVFLDEHVDEQSLAILPVNGVGISSIMLFCFTFKLTGDKSEFNI